METTKKHGTASVVSAADSQSACLHPASGDRRILGPLAALPLGGGDARLHPGFCLPQRVFVNAPTRPLSFGSVSLLALVVAGMIGSGVFTTTGYALASLGSPQAVLAAWAVAGLIATAGAIAYGALAARLPLSGGEYTYLSRRLHPLAGFLAGWISLASGFSGSIALAALTCERYTTPLLGWENRLPDRWLATMIILVCGIAHATAGRLATRANTAIVILKLLLLTGFLAVGFLLLGTTPPLPGQRDSYRVELAAFATSVMWISYSYAGFNQAVYVAGEAAFAHRTVPRALVLGTLLTTVLYLLLNDLFLRAAPADQIMGQTEVAAITAAALGGRLFERLIRGVIALATLTSVAGMMTAGPRLYTQMAEDGLFPRIFTGPAGVGRSALLQTVIAVSLVHAATLLQLIGYLGVTLSLCSAVTVSTLWLPARAGPSAKTDPTSTRRPSAPVLAASLFYVFATLLAAGLMTAQDPRHLLGTGITLGVGAAIWVLLGCFRPGRNTP